LSKLQLRCVQVGQPRRRSRLHFARDDNLVLQSTRLLPLLLALLSALWALPTAAAAQTDTLLPGPRLSRPGALCAYDACALRIEGGSVVQGAAGSRVAGLGIFSNVAGRVRWSSDSALHYARSYGSNHTAAGVTRGLASAGGIVATVLLVQAYLDARDRAGDGGTVGLDRSKLHAVYGVAIGSSVVGFVGRLFEGHARKQLARAIWWHNRELPR
jgi:hypothetical protein